ncbi:ATP-binding cassette domain-containing protein [Paenibacillus sp. FSL H7-0331]|uniref:ABC transporter ATP-binding protein n=1 Tax=Paenibacillus sp. FSL H7-0331 TaxID=1920421 RepID=UPI00096FAED7|nr:ATP-binding cassette domain-containing protein [Paenibacillus sp. FSL H7-0331]OMF18380.1 ABC transporter [Paenibacillus sp. FSL H7-0331]
MSILRIHQLRKHIQQKEQRVLFDDFSVEINEPEIISVVGASGQGKSTLLRIIGMLDTPDKGTLTYRGKLSNEWQPPMWRSKVSYVAQQAVMLPGSVEDNLRTVSRLQKQPFDRELTKQLLEAVQLESLDWSKRAEDLSGGEKQRVALVRSMLLRPEILLVDEITASLDVRSKQAVEELLFDWHSREGTTFIWVTHDLEQARHTSSHVWFMAENRLYENSQTSAFFERPETDLARKFVQVSQDPVGIGEHR